MDDAEHLEQQRILHQQQDEEDELYYQSKEYIQDQIADAHISRMRSGWKEREKVAQAKTLRADMLSAPHLRESASFDCSPSGSKRKHVINR